MCAVDVSMIPALLEAIRDKNAKVSLDLDGEEVKPAAPPRQQQQYLNQYPQNSLPVKKAKKLGSMARAAISRNYRLENENNVSAPSNVSFGLSSAPPNGRRSSASDSFSSLGGGMVHHGQEEDEDSLEQCMVLEHLQQGRSLGSAAATAPRRRKELSEMEFSPTIKTKVRGEALNDSTLSSGGGRKRSKTINEDTASVGNNTSANSSAQSSHSSSYGLRPKKPRPNAGRGASHFLDDSVYSNEEVGGFYESIFWIKWQLFCNICWFRKTRSPFLIRTTVSQLRYLLLAEAKEDLAHAPLTAAIITPLSVDTPQ